ncbi:MAG: exodeoxyribonuclease VII small subunit [Christensenellales bacterium]
MAKKELTFEQAKEKLDGIVEKLSSGNLPIDQMVKLYEEGAELSQHCLGLLSAYEARLEQVDKYLLEE